MSFVALFSRLQHRQRTLKGDQRTRKEEKRRWERREARFLFVSLSLSLGSSRQRKGRARKEGKKERKKREKSSSLFLFSLSLYSLSPRRLRHPPKKKRGIKLSLFLVENYGKKNSQRKEKLPKKKKTIS
jgi:hypothetical protein